MRDKKKKYSTKDDIIDDYNDSRPILNRNEVEDLVNCCFKYIKKKMIQVGTTDTAYFIDNFGHFYEHEFDTRHLVLGTHDVKRIKAEKMMLEYLDSYLVKPIKLDLRNDIPFRM